MLSKMLQYRTVLGQELAHIQNEKRCTANDKSTGMKKDNVVTDRLAQLSRTIIGPVPVKCDG